MNILVYYFNKGKVTDYREILMDDETNEGIVLMRVVSDLNNKSICEDIGVRPLKIMDRISINDNLYEYNGRCFNKI